MGQVIDISLVAKVEGGPTISFSKSFNVDAYDRLEVTVDATGNETIQLVPVATSTIQCLFITSNQYGSDLTYTVNGGADSIALDSPQSFIGAGAVSALASAAIPSTLEVTNNLAEEVQLQILVGRSAVAP